MVSDTWELTAHSGLKVHDVNIRCCHTIFSFLFFLKSTTYLKWGVSLMIHSKLKGSLINFSSYLQSHMYIYLNTFISGCFDGLRLGSLLVGSRQVGPECSSSTASIHQPPNQDKVPCPRLESSMRDITLLRRLD